MSREEQLEAMRKEAHRLLDEMLDASAAYYGCADNEEQARRLEALSNIRSATCDIVDAYGTAIAYPNAFPPDVAIARQIRVACREPADEAVALLLEQVAVRISTPATDDRVVV